MQQPSLARFVMTMSMVTIFPMTLVNAKNSNDLTFKINTDTVVAKISPTFASFGWEMWGMMGELSLLTDQRFITAASHLAPAVVRVGGITADWVTYTDMDTNGKKLHASLNEISDTPSVFSTHQLGGPWPNSTKNLSVSQFETLESFSTQSRLSLLFDLNELYGRNCNTTKPWSHPPQGNWCIGDWDTSNVRDFLQYLHDNLFVGHNNSLFAFELGNELISHMYANTTVADIKELAGIVQSIWSDVPYDQRPGVFAPSTDACFNQDQLDIIANISNTPGVVGYTYHAYPGGNGENKTALPVILVNSTWLRTGIMTGSESYMCIDAWNAGPRSTGLLLWITEASSSYTSELPSPAQDSFLHGFFTIPQFGQYAPTGVGMIGRWAFSEGSRFGTIRKNESRFDVAHDYWIIKAFKQTVGAGVLSLTGAENGDVLAYAYCSPYNNGSITITAINVGQSESSFSLSTMQGATMNVSPRIEFVFTAPNGDMGSFTPVLNGNTADPVRLNDDGTLPSSWIPKFVFTSADITMPPRSQAYFVLLNTKASACM